ncbi:hypothetical protein AX15_006709 [Amanita polypyramis BW_CC]|nr:hypothetical protein AX15_006709 [Amanita polypyramis BW_CC]
MALPALFSNPDKPLGVPKTVVPESLRLRNDDYYTAMVDTMVAPSQDSIEEHQVFITNIYKIIKGKLQEEEGIFLTSDVEVTEEKWSPLALDADIPPADIINQEWANMHSHTEFLREQACLNNLAAAQWQVFWTANPPDIKKYPDLYTQWSKLDDYCHLTTQTWYNICFKELKEMMAEALNIDPVTLHELKTSTTWLVDEFERVGSDPKYMAHQATAHTESVALSKQVSRTPTPAVPQSPKPRLKSADPVLRSHPTTPENKAQIDIKTPTLQRIQDRLQSVVSDITSLDYINKQPVVKEEPISPKDEIMAESSSIMNKPKMILVVASPKMAPISTDKMDTTVDFTLEEKQPAVFSSNTLSTGNDTTPPKVNKGKGREKPIYRAHSTPIRHLSDPKSLIDFMELAEVTLSREDMIAFHKELDE